MLISLEEIRHILLSKNITIDGCFHIGAHDCEELDFYNKLGIQNENIVWIDAIPSKAIEAKNRGIPNVYTAVVTDKDDEEVTFNLSNNPQSSSVLELGTHLDYYPGIYYVDQIRTRSITIDTFFKRNNLDNTKYNFWNFDIQGAEMMALRGAPESIKYAKVIYLEVTDSELYKNCGQIGDMDAFLSKYGFKRVLTKMTGESWGDALYILDNW